MNKEKEPVFTSAIRNFLNTIFIILGAIVGVVFIAITISFFSRPYGHTPKTSINLVADANGNRKLLSQNSPAILRIDIEGFIGSKFLNDKTIQKLLLASQESPLKKGRIKGILVVFRTPGGVAYDSDAIYQALQTYKHKYNVPIYGYVDGMCASGGMLISAACDKLNSNASGVIGSVGVKIGPFFNVSKLMDRFGIESKTLYEGKDKDILNPFQTWKKEDDKSIQNILDYEYKRFVDTLCKGRKTLNKQKLIDVYGAQVFNPQSAQEKGFIDEANSSYSETLQELTVVAGISADTPYQVIQIKLHRPYFANLVESKAFPFNTEIKHTFDFGDAFDLSLVNKVLTIYSPSDETL